MASDSQVSTRDIFLSHRSVDKDLVRRLAADIRACTVQGRELRPWVDEAEIRPGQSIPGQINSGLENSRFFGIVMTPSYFESESGWTDAEWHSALHSDPDNRRGRIIPLLAANCPYVPFLLRHLNAIDLRDANYHRGLKQLISLLRGESLPRPVTYRGQLITPTGQIDRDTLVAQRSVVDSVPDVVTEHLYCNLLRVESIPRDVYVASVSRKLCHPKIDGTEALPTKAEVKAAILAAQRESGQQHPFTPAFRLDGDEVVTFHDLEAADSVFAPVIKDGTVTRVSSADLLREEDARRLVISLLNMAVSRHACRAGLVADNTKLGRFYFPPRKGANNIITWVPKKVKARRTVAKPCSSEGTVAFWRHLGAYLKVVFLAGKLYMQIVPTWVITEDGFRVRGGPGVGGLVNRWTGPERNLHLLYHVRFWTTVLRLRPGPISIRAGDQSVELSTIPAFIELSYGIEHDDRDLMGLLDQEAEIIAETEDEIADRAAELGIALTSESDEELPADGDKQETDVREER